MKHLQAALHGTAEPTWNQVVADFFQVAVLGPRELFNEAMAFQGELLLDPNSKMPRSQSPEETLKFLGRQLLGRQ